MDKLIKKNLRIVKFMGLEEGKVKGVTHYRVPGGFLKDYELKYEERIDLLLGVVEKIKTLKNKEGYLLEVHLAPNLFWVELDGWGFITYSDWWLGSKSQEHLIFRGINQFIKFYNKKPELFGSIN